MINYHLKEIKYRIIYCILVYIINIIIIWYYHDIILSYLIPLHLIFTSLTEGFYLSIQFSFTLGLIYTIPFIYWQLLEFIIPGFYEYEVNKFISINKIFLLFILFLYLFKHFILLLTNFFLQFQSDYLTIALRFYNFINFINQTLILFIILFILLISIKYIYKLFIKNRKLNYFLLLIFLAIITPPDIISLIISFLIIFLIFEFTFLYLFIVNIINKYYIN